MVELVRPVAGKVHGVMQQAQDLDDSFVGRLDCAEQDDMSAPSATAGHMKSIDARTNVRPLPRSERGRTGTQGLDGRS